MTNMIVIIFPLMADIYPAASRTMLTGFTYNITISIMSLTPVLIGYLSDKFNTPAVAWLFIVVISLICLANIHDFDQDKVYKIKDT